MLKVYFDPQTRAVLIEFDRQGREQLRLLLEYIDRPGEHEHLLQGMDFPYGLDAGTEESFWGVSALELHLGWTKDETD
ncbi:hypothetical protein HRbin15_01684 [bacterium HR15]|nr:hypothetical protein HRbin15_01684 [bacterium HR15]